TVDGRSEASTEEGLRQRSQQVEELESLTSVFIRVFLFPLPMGRSRSRSRDRERRHRRDRRSRSRDRRSRSRDRRSRSRDRSGRHESRRPSEDADVDELRRRVRRLEEVNKQLRHENLELMRQLVAMKEGTSNGADKAVSKSEPAHPAQKAEEKPQQEEAKVDDDEQQQMAMTFNCCQLVNFTHEVFNQKIPNNVPIEHRGPTIEKKLADFCQFFAKDAMVVDANTKKPILEDLRDIRARYQTVFRESGSDLEIKTLRRWYFEADKEGALEYCIDFEHHAHIVSPRPGLRLDGALGVVGPRDVDLITLYKSSNGKIDCMWLLPDKNHIGQDKILGQTDLEESQAYQGLLEIIKEDAKKSKAAVPTKVHYYDYNKVQTIG
ncbi:hypothetical protein FOZ62_012550, partial [Perkinsus olseni]